MNEWTLMFVGMIVLVVCVLALPAMLLVLLIKRSQR